jgi:hypothetical protein
MGNETFFSVIFSVWGKWKIVDNEKIMKLFGMKTIKFFELDFLPLLGWKGLKIGIFR